MTLLLKEFLSGDHISSGIVILERASLLISFMRENFLIVSCIISLEGKSFPTLRKAWSLGFYSLQYECWTLRPHRSGIP